MDNPLAQICKRLGVSHLALAQMTGLHAEAVKNAIGEDPSVAVKAYIAALDALGVHLRLRPAGPLEFWFDRPWIEWLYFNDEFRALWNFPKFPPNRRRLRMLVSRFKRDKKYSLKKLAKIMEQGHVCTTDGLRHWRHTTVGLLVKISHAKMRFKTDMLELRPDEECMRDWRQFIKDRIMARICPEDPLAPMRYQLTWSEDGGRLYLKANRPMPEKPREWIIRAVRNIEWLESERWGLIEDV